MRADEEEGKGGEGELRLLSPFLHVVLDEFFGVFFEDVVDFIDQLVDVFLKLLAGLDDLGVGFDFFFTLRFSSGLLACAPVFPSSTSLRLELVDQPLILRSPYSRSLRTVKPRRDESRSLASPSASPSCCLPIESFYHYYTISETISSATMLMTLIIGFTAGPAVSL